MTSKTDRQRKRETEARKRLMREVWRKQRGGDVELRRAQVARYGGIK